MFAASRLALWHLACSHQPLRHAAPRLSCTVSDLEGAENLFAAARLLRASFAPESNPVSAAAIVAEHMLSLRERRDANIQLIARDDDSGNLVGFVEVFTTDFLTSELGEEYPARVRKLLKPYVASLAVQQDYRRRGVASLLMRTAEARVAAGPLPHTLSLEVEEGSAALALYTRLGYAVVGRDDNGRRLDGDLFFGRSVPVTKLALEKRVEAAAGDVLSRSPLEPRL